MLIRRSGTQIIGEGRPANLLDEIVLSRASDFSIGPLQVQPSVLQVQFGGSSQTVEPRVMQVLVLLAGERGAVVSRDRLIECCWSGRAVSEDAINRCIAKVRRLGAESDAYEIETIPRVGYRLVEAGQPVSPAMRTRPGRRGLAAIAAVLALALVAGGLWYRRASEVSLQPTVAVLPFTALNSDPAARSLGEVITTRVSTALVQTGAQVPAGDPRTIDDARRAGAAMIVSGTVERVGAGFRVTARVDSSRSQAALQTMEFEASGGDTPMLVGQVANWLVPAFRMWASFLPAERDAAITDQIMSIFLTRTSGDLDREWKLARMLATANPNSGSAQWVYAFLWEDKMWKGSTDGPAATVASGRRAAERAALLLQKPGRAKILLDCYYTAPGFFVLTVRCDQTARAAFLDDPDIPVMPYLFAMQLTNSGRFVDASHYADMDLAAAPLGMGPLAWRLFAGLMSGNPDDALSELEARARRYGGPTALASFVFDAAVATGDIPRAQAMLDNQQVARDIAVGDTKEIAQLAFNAIESKSPEDIAAMRKSCTPVPPDFIPDDRARQICLVGFAMLGDMDALFALAYDTFPEIACCSVSKQQQQWLARQGNYPERWVLSAKAMAPARADPRFIELARRTGLLAYWKSGHPPDFCMIEKVPVCALLKSN